VHCSKVFADTSEEVLKGCGDCGSKFFFYVRQEQLEKMEKSLPIDELDSKEKKQVEHDVREIVGLEDEEAPIFLDFESVKVVKSGKYLLDLAKLFARDKPKVYKLEDGKYIVDLAGLRNKE